MVSLQHVCAVWRGSKDAQRATLTQRVLRISNWTSPNSKSIFSNLWTIDYTFLRQISLWLKNSLSTGWSNPASFWSTRPSKEGWSSQTLTASRMTSAIFSAGLPPGKHKRNRLPKVRVWKGRNCVETWPPPKPGRLGGCDLHDWWTKVFQFICTCLRKISVPLSCEKYVAFLCNDSYWLVLVRNLLCQVLSGRLRFSFCGGLCEQAVHIRALHWSAGSRGATFMFLLCLNSFCNLDILTFWAHNSVKEDHIHDDHDLCQFNIVVITKIFVRLIRLWRWPWSSGCAAVHWKRTKRSRGWRY